MKGIILSLIMFCGLSISSVSAEDKLYMQHCSNVGSDVSYFFQSCVNNNFSDIRRELNNGFFRYCSNIGSEVSYFFTSCINDNFREAQSKLDNYVYLSHCSNFGREMDFMFVSCVNRNFREIERELRRRQN